MNDKVLVLATKAKMHGEALKWFTDDDIETCEDVALLVADESQTDKNIIEAMIGDGIDELKAAGDKIAVTKFWTWCRAV